MVAPSGLSQMGGSSDLCSGQIVKPHHTNEAPSAAAHATRAPLSSIHTHAIARHAHHDTPRHATDATDTTGCTWPHRRRGINSNMGNNARARDTSSWASTVRVGTLPVYDGALLR